jgi:hypothetical protein
MSQSKSYFVRLLLFSCLTSAIVVLWEHFASPRFQTNLGWAILLFFILATYLIYNVLTKISEQEPKKFIYRFMMISGLRLFGYLTIILIYALFKREAALGFTLLFLIMYLLFSAFEIATLSKFLKK